MSWWERQLNKLFAPANFTPVYTPYDLMTYTSVTTTKARAGRKSNNFAWVSVVVTGTIGGTLSSAIDITGFPDAALYSGQVLAARVQEGTVTAGGVAFFSNNTILRVKKRDGSNFTAGTVSIGVTGDYEIG